MAAIDRKEFTSWTLKVQIMPVADAANYRFNPFDLTKVWPYADYPVMEVGKLVLDRNPDNYFADVEQSAFNPANYVPGIGPSPDKMLQGRLFACADTQRYRLGINHTQLPVNRPHAAQAANYGRDGLMRFDGNGGGKDRHGCFDRLQYSPAAHTTSVRGADIAALIFGAHGGPAY
jgi:catalase